MRESMNDDLLFFDQVAQSTHHRHSQEVPTINHNNMDL